MREQGVDLDALAVQDTHAQAESGEGPVDLRPHDVAEREPAPRCPHDERAALGQPGDRLAGEVVVREQPSAVGVPLEGLAEQRAEDGVGLGGVAEDGGEPAEHLRPRTELARAVVAVDHRDEVARRGGDDVELGVDRRQRPLEDDHGEDARPDADVAGARRNGVGRDHAGAGVALGRAQRDARLEGARRVEQGGALLGEPAGVLPGGEHLGQQVLELPAEPAVGDELVEAAEQLLGVAAGRGVDREHARRVADAQYPAPGQAPVDVAGERGEEADLRHVRLVVEDRLVVVGDGPPQRDVVPEELAELGRGALGRGVAPRTEGDEELAVAVEGEVAVHHRGHAHGPDGRRAHAVPVLRVGEDRGDAGLQAAPHGFEGVGPHAVDELVLPVVAAGREDGPVGADEAGLDAGGSELDAQRRAAGADRCLGMSVSTAMSLQFLR